MSLLEISGIDHINMCVTNLERSIAFYRDVFGFEVKEDHRELEKYPWVTLGVANTAYLVLYQTDEAKARRDMRIVHFGFALKDAPAFDRVFEKVLKAGVPTLNDQHGKPYVVHYPHSSSFYLIDPDGYEIDVSIRFGGGLDQQ